jgi:epoxide hydrolase-like predicted phosphatase
LLRTIIFDLGRVLVPFDFNRAYERMEAMTGLTRDEIVERIRAANLVRPFESGQLDPRDFVERLTGAIGVRMSYSEFGDLWSSIFLPETLIPDRVVASLKDRYRLLLLSNTNAIHFEMIEANYPILRHFDHFVLSYKVGAMKPDPKIYREALAHAEGEPGECFFTDDIAEYVEGARREGIDAVQFENCEQILGELRARGVEV